MDELPRYWVYICASTAQADRADWLTKALMRYRVPKHIVGQASRDGSVPKRLTPIFRHRQETPASADLDDDIRQALAQSRYLIAVCSPEAAVSRWVNEEIRYFKALGRQDRVLCLIVDGEPNVSEKSNRGMLECFPRAVRYRLDVSGQLSDTPTEPIAADARADRDGKQNAKLKLLAGVLGIGFDQLRQRERQRTMRGRMRNAVLAGVVLIILGGIWAWQQQQQNELARQSRIAKLTEQGRVALIDGRFDLALTHLKQAQALGGATPSQRFLHHQATAFAENARTGVNTLVLQLGGHEDQISTIAMSADGARSLTASTDARALIWDAASGNLQAALVGHRGPLGIAQFSHRAKRIATAAAPIGATNNVDIIDVDRLRSGTIIVDDSAPHCFNETNAIGRATHKNDILFIEGGIVELPFPIGEVKKQIRHDAETILPTIIGDRPPSYITSYILGSILLSRFHELGATIGLVDIHQAVAYFDKLKALGITGCIHFDRYFSGMKEALPPDRLERFIESTRKNRP